MAIDKELLNQQLVATEVHTGVYQDRQRRVCVVVRVKEGHVHYLTFLNCTVQLHSSFKEKFLTDYPVELYHYPAMRALRKFARYIHEGFSATPEARTVLRSVLR
jgi:hypothetical protein